MRILKLFSTKKQLIEILRNKENIIFELNGKIEFSPRISFTALVFWTNFLIVNLISVIFGKFSQTTTKMVVTSNRILVVIEDSFDLPKWLIPYGNNNTRIILFDHKVAGINFEESKRFWSNLAKRYNDDTFSSFEIAFDGVVLDGFGSIRFKIL